MQDCFGFWQLYPSESWAWRWHNCLACGDPGNAKCARTWIASTAGFMALSESFFFFFFFLASCSWQSECFFGLSFSIAPPVWALRGLPCLGVLLCCSTHQSHRWATLAGVLLCRSVHQALKEAPWVGSYFFISVSGIWWASLSIVQLPMLGMGRERLWWWLHPLCMTQRYCLASMAAWVSSHHNLLPHIPSIHLSAVISSPCPGIAPQSLNSSSQPLCLPGDLCPCPGWVWLWQGLYDSHSI